MAIKAKDIYDGRKKSRFRGGAIITVILALIVAAILIFYGLRQYAVYDENGNATLILPFSQKETSEIPEESQTPNPSESPESSPSESPVESPAVSPSASPVASPPAIPETSPSVG